MTEGVNRPLAPDYPPPAGAPPGRASRVRTFANAAEARRWIEANASLPERTLGEALDVINQHAWQTGVDAKRASGDTLADAVDAVVSDEKSAVGQGPRFVLACALDEYRNPGAMAELVRRYEAMAGDDTEAY